MDIDDILDDKFFNGENFIFNGIICDYFFEFVCWGKFLFIVGFVGLGFVVFMLLFFGSIFFLMVGVAGLGGFGVVVMIFYLVMFVLVLVLFYYFY